ncbi:hypothetical protein GCM10009555_018290 [Acrocarpospora macrocephala]|uniref:Uncharacterized protein n=1 Tax=Acrocarpospora macrocephala TaxID=150177 RepID=A0A5M3WGX5_9ACTN|nr:hypothetical protein [Acrocarpospora macrocephala]GES07489.1 hypothetical protein Amac_010840 [Acrocarpospora macrocephala]
MPLCCPVADPCDRHKTKLTGAEPDWNVRTERLLEAALYALRSEEDPLPLISAAETACRISVGELPAAEMDGYPFPGEDSGPECTCPTDLKARGGFTSSCRACSPAIPRPTTSEPSEGGSR